MLSCRRLAPGRMSFEQWINCRLGFGISIPEFVAARDGGRYASDVYNATIPDSGAEVQRSISKSDGARNLLLLGYRASLVAENRRTIERRLICTLHLGERSILRFKFSRPSPARDKERPPPPAAISSCRHCAFRDRQPGLAGATNGRDRERFEPPAYRDAPYLRAGKSC